MFSSFSSYIKKAIYMGVHSLAWDKINSRRFWVERLWEVEFGVGGSSAGMWFHRVYPLMLPFPSGELNSLVWKSGIIPDPKWKMTTLL